MMFRSTSVVLIVFFLSGLCANKIKFSLMNILKRCEETDESLTTCLKFKALTLLDRAVMSEKPFVINDYFSFQPDKENAYAHIVEKPEQVSNLSPDPQERDVQLDSMINDKITTLLRSRSLRFSLPVQSEGRKKGKKGGPIIAAALAFGAFAIQMAMGKIALLAGKALLVGKMALLISALIGLKKIIGSGGGGHHDQVVHVEGHGGHGRSRTYTDEEKAHQLAYEAQARSH